MKGLECQVTRFRFKVGRQWGATEVFEARGDISRSVFRDNHSGCRRERGGETESMMAVRWLGPQSCGGCSPTRGSAWGIEGRARPPRLLGTRASGWWTVPAPPLQDQRSCVCPWFLQQPLPHEVPCRWLDQPFPFERRAPRAGSHHLLARSHGA